MKTILIVDDSRSARFFLSSCIPKEFAEVHEATTGQEGIERYSELKPDLVFMDLTMPGMDGFAAIDHIRETDPDARIVVLTADIQRQTQERIAAAGVTSFLKKPPKKPAVREALEAIFPGELA